MVLFGNVGSNHIHLKGRWFCLDNNCIQFEFIPDVLSMCMPVSSYIVRFGEQVTWWLGRLTFVEG